MKLFDWYKIWSGLQYHYKISGEYIENMIPFERDLLINMFANIIEESNPNNKNISYEGIELDGQ